MRCCARLLLAASAASAEPSWDAGPFAARDRAPEGERRLRAAGPLWESRAGEDGRAFQALRPLTSAWDAPGAKRGGRDLLWPLGVARHDADELFWRFANIYAFDYATETRSRGRFVIFPVFFSGRNSAGRLYAALFPLGGSIYEYLGQDRMRFVLFPLYADSAVNAVRTQTVLWPVFSRTRGPGVRRARVFPFYGYSERDAHWRKQFVLWPVWTSVEDRYPDSTGGGFLLFPLYGRLRAGENESWTVLPPFFRGATGPQQRSLRAPWPFVRIDRGAVDQTALWPLWGRRRQANLETGFVLWPLGYHERVTRQDETLHRLMALPVFYSERVETRPAAEDGAAPEVLSRYWKLWPLVSWRREPEASRLRLLALWPLKQTAPIERNYAPLWSLYTRSRAGDTVDDELLWGLWRRRTEADGGGRWSLFPLLAAQREPARDAREISALGGLVRYRREGSQRAWKLLYCLQFGTPDATP
jgi:hypothetical protein